MPWKSKCEDPAILTHPHSYPLSFSGSPSLLPSHCCFWWIFCECCFTSYSFREYIFFRWFLRLSPLWNVYALIMNCFSARIPTELKLFNFPYFLLSLALYSQARLLPPPYISFMSACIQICVKLRFCHREPFKISAMRFTHKLHFLNLKFDEEFLSTTIQKSDSCIFSCESWFCHAHL